MKKLMVISSILMVFAILTSGCSMLQLNQDNQTVLIKAAARVAGNRFALRNPDLAITALPYARTLAELANGTFTDSEKLVNELWPAAVKSLLGSINDPILQLTISDVAGMVQIRVPNVSTGVKLGQIRAALQGFIEGVEASKRG